MDHGRIVLSLCFLRFFRAFPAGKSVDHIRSHIGAGGSHGRHEARFNQFDVDSVSAIAPIFFNHTRKTFRAIFRAEVVEHIATPKPAKIAAITRTAPRSPFRSNAGVPFAAFADWRSYRLRPSLTPPGPSRRLNGHLQTLRCNPNNSGAEFKNLGPHFAVFGSSGGFAAHVWLSGAPGFRTPSRIKSGLSAA